MASAVLLGAWQGIRLKTGADCGSFREDGTEDEAKPGYLLQMQAECSVRWEQRVVLFRHDCGCDALAAIEGICGGIFVFCITKCPFLIFHICYVSSVKNPRFLTWWILIKGGTLQPLFVCFRKCQGALMPFLLSENTCSRCSKTAAFYNTNGYTEQQIEETLSKDSFREYSFRRCSL